MKYLILQLLVASPFFFAATKFAIHASKKRKETKVPNWLIEYMQMLVIVFIMLMMFGFFGRDE